jgi:CheY-like chemotaxis protein
MAIVLAIEPDARQAATLKRVVRERAHAEICVVDSKDAAIAAMDANPPDLILLTALLSPRDEEELVAHLRTLQQADHMQTITIPLLASATAGAGGGDDAGFLRKFKKKKGRDSGGVGADPWKFAEEVAGYLRAAVEARAERQTREAASAWPAPTPVTDLPPATAAHEWPATQTARTETVPESPAVETPRTETVHEWPAAETPAAETVHEWPAAEAPRTETVHEWPAAEAPRTETIHEWPAAEAPRTETVHAFSATETPAAEAIHEWPGAEAPRAGTVHEWPASEAPQPADAGRDLSPGEERPAASIEAPHFEMAPEPQAADAAPQEDAHATLIAGRPDSPEPIYLTSPERVFDAVISAATREPVMHSKAVEPIERLEPIEPLEPLEPLERIEPLEPLEPIKPVEPVVTLPPAYRPLRRLPPLAMWARVEEVVVPAPEPVAELTPENDTHGIVSSLRVPAHALAVTYPRRPYIRHVRAA